MRSFTTKEGGSPQSLVQRYRASDPIFNKYSSGATPPNKRASKVSSNFLVNQDDLFKKNPYYLESGNNTMPVVHQNFVKTMSPITGMQILDSELSASSKRKRIEEDPFKSGQLERPQIKQKLMFEDLSNDDDLHKA